MNKQSARVIASKIDIIRNGVRFGGLVYTEPPALSCTADGEICMSLQATVREHDEMDVMTDMLRPCVVIDDVETPLGDYVVGTLKTIKKDNARWWQIEAYDQSLLCKRSKIETAYHIAAGTLYIDAINGLLVDSGITRVISDANTDTLTTDREDWDIGTSRLTIINALLAEINYYPLYFDLGGSARLTKKAEVNATNATITYAADAMSILYSEVSSELDIFDAPNVFIVQMSNPDQTVMTATSENTTPASALSIIRRKQRIPKVFKVDNIASQAALQEYADNLRNDSLLSTETVEFYTAINPVHAVHDVLVLQHPDLEGVFLETGWSMSIKAGEKMTHRAKRVLYL